LAYMALRGKIRVGKIRVRCVYVCVCVCKKILSLNPCNLNVKFWLRVIVDISVVHVSNFLLDSVKIEEAEKVLAHDRDL